MNGPFKIKGFSGFGNSPLNKKPPKIDYTKLESVARTYMAKRKLKTGIAKTHMVKQKFPKSRISTLTRAARIAGRLLPNIGLASLMVKQKWRGKRKGATKTIIKGIKSIKKP